MALIIILSVYNGFDTLIKSQYQMYQPDFVITPSEGKSFSANSGQFEQIASLPGVTQLFPVVEETVFAIYDNRQSIATIRGVEEAYGQISGISENVVEGEFKLGFGDVGNAVIGSGLATELRLRVRFLSPIELYFPDRNSQISMINPAASLNDELLYPSGIISLNNDFDKSGIYIPISKARELLSYGEHEATSVEIYMDKSSGESLRGVYSEREKELEKILGASFVVKNRYEQNETLYKMMRSEKFAVYMILFFVILVVSINIFGSLSMLILEKKHDIQTYLSMGAGSGIINRIFVLQGWLISFFGAVVGVVIGLILCFIQQQYGIIPMPGNYIVDSYPVDIHFADVVITLSGVLLIGYLISILPVRLLKRS
ncbi:MAG: ABC transporter permease [Bacteroidales bacterium]|nr:ABC transporter permease [Bacteroidales bacterium]